MSYFQKKNSSVDESALQPPKATCFTKAVLKFKQLNKSKVNNLNQEIKSYQTEMNQNFGFYARQSIDFNQKSSNNFGILTQAKIQEIDET